MVKVATAVVVLVGARFRLEAGRWTRELEWFRTAVERVAVMVRDAGVVMNVRLGLTALANGAGGAQGTSYDNE